MSGPGILLGFGAVTAALVWMDAGPASGFRHLYLVPTLWAALRFGGLGGGSGGLLGALLYAPFVLPAIERDGLTADAVEGLISLGLFLFVGSVTGALARRAWTRAARVQLLLSLQGALTGGEGLRDLLGEVVRQLQTALEAEAVAIVLGGGAEPPVAARGAEGAGAVAEDSAARWVLRAGESLFVSDLESDRRLGAPCWCRSAPARGGWGCW